MLFLLLPQASPKVTFNAPENPGKYNLKLYVMCDSYAGCDQEFDFELDVGEAESDSDSESD